MSLPIPIEVVYLGLAGCVLALLVAVYQQNWKLSVLFLLLLRLAIGWQFAFEGMNKINSNLVGPSETNRPFTSEPYFKASPTKVGAMMRAQFDDVDGTIAAKVKATRDLKDFEKLSLDDQANACPSAVAKELDAVPNADANAVREAKAEYARWVHGVDGRPTKVKFVTGDVSMTAPERLAHLDWIRGQGKVTDDFRTSKLGVGNGLEVKRAAELRTDLVTAEADLAKDANAFVAELTTRLNGGKSLTDVTNAAPLLESEDASKKEAAEKLFQERLGQTDFATLKQAVADTKSDDVHKRIAARFIVDELVRKAQPQSMGKLNDKITMYFLGVVGACLFFGLLTRLSCVLAAGFLIVTYLAFPPFPWYPNPPNTEGNPLFVNKNLIEVFALLALACFPTGRWLGLDAIVHWVLFGRRADVNNPAPN